MCSSDPSLWEKKLCAAAFAVNKSLNTSLQFLPFELLHGYIPKLPKERFRRPRDETLEARLLDLAKTRAEAQGNTARAQQSRKRIYDKTHRDRTYRVGQYVWLQRQEPITDGTTKLAPTFKGPYKITEQKTPITFVIRRANPDIDNSSAADGKVAHVSQLKPFHQPYIDPALFQAQIFQPSTSDRQQTATISDGLQAETALHDASGGDDSSELSTQSSDSTSCDNACVRVTPS
ncbi:hypothetical protein MTO96_011392 [Rhipicephalus appendiculatus]